MRGKAIQPNRDCDYCAKQLPGLRHPKARYCNSDCRQRDRYQREHATGNGIKCLDCGKLFTRVGSHIIQVHGYESAIEYRIEHGLMAKETRTSDHASKMRRKAHNLENLQFGKNTRYQKGGKHGKQVTEFWRNRKSKMDYKKLNSTLRGESRL